MLFRHMWPRRFAKASSFSFKMLCLFHVSQMPGPPATALRTLGIPLSGCAPRRGTSFAIASLVAPSFLNSANIHILCVSSSRANRLTLSANVRRKGPKNDEVDIHAELLQISRAASAFSILYTALLSGDGFSSFNVEFTMIRTVQYPVHIPPVNTFV
jgi:hypothetical protein